MKFNSLVPELSVSDIDKSLAFYVDVLGFEVEYQRIENKFAFLSYGEAQIMLEEVNDNWNVASLKYPFGRGVNFQIEVISVAKIYNSLKNNNIKLFKDVFVSSYKVNDEVFKEKEVLVQDPDGYLLRFSETLK